VLFEPSDDHSKHTSQVPNVQQYTEMTLLEPSQIHTNELPEEHSQEPSTQSVPLTSKDMACESSLDPLQNHVQVSTLIAKST